LPKRNFSLTALSLKRKTARRHNSALFSDEEKEFYQKEISPDKRALPLCLREGIAAFVIAPQIALPAFFKTEESVTRGFFG
jgi:hypothetical protein